MGMLEAMRQHPSIFQPLFSDTTKLTIMDMLSMFTITRHGSTGKMTIEGTVLNVRQLLLQRIDGNKLA